MSATHTPGPWECSEHKFPLPPFEGALESEWGVYPPLGESGPVAITAGENNARLIAAAPELLAALIDLDEAYCDTGPDMTREKRDFGRKALIAARAAISKAMKL